MREKIIFLLLVVFLLGCTQIKPTQPVQQYQNAIPAVQPAKNATEPKPECVSDKECLPATCCHASACVPSGKEPSCFNVVCTQGCEQVSLDCGRGKCECVNKKCTAVIYS